MISPFPRLLLLLCCAAMNPVFAGELLIDNFSEGDSGIWEKIPEEADYAGGFLKLSSSSSQVLLNSAEEFQNCEMEMKFSVDTLSDGDDVFYYLGFQTVQPWMRDAIYLMVQGSTFVVVVAKGGEVNFNQSLTDVTVVPGQAYELTIQWTPKFVSLLLDGVTIFYTDEIAKIPVDPLFAFLAINKTNPEGEPSILNATSLEIKDL